jgi:aspartate carbamoyltransferase catalytic subunit
VRHLLSIEDLGREGIEDLLSLTDAMVEVSRRAVPKVPALRGRTIATLFYEDSTRTKLSFEVAARRLSADLMGFSVSTSSVNKGESLRDTVQTLQAMGPDCIIVRHRSAGAPWQVARFSDAHVVNAGDGWHEHPTQALLDAYTLRERWGGSLEGRHVAIVGDTKHSRVCRSNVLALRALGATVTLVAPGTLLPPSLEGWDVETSHDLDDVLPRVDAVYLLRMQRERMEDQLLPSLREYRIAYGLDKRRVDLLQPHAVVLHPGPMNRGIEIAGDIADLPRSLVIDQVRNGVAVRMAVLFWLFEQDGGAASRPSVQAAVAVDEEPVDA